MGWKLFIRAVPDWMCTRTRLLAAFAWPAGPKYRPKCGPSGRRRAASSTSRLGWPSTGAHMWRWKRRLSWAGMCPRNDQSAGKRRSSRLRKGTPWLKTTLVQCAWAATRKNDSYLQAQFRRLRSRRGPKKAICAVAASILTAVYHMLRDGTFYQDLGPNHFRRDSPEEHANRLVRQIAKLGFSCVLTPATSVGGFCLATAT